METFFRVTRKKLPKFLIPGVPRKTAGFVGWVPHSSFLIQKSTPKGAFLIIARVFI
jgi:hypothetical protein